MLVVLLLWVYIFCISLIIGFFSLTKAYAFVGERRDVHIAPAFIAGTLLLTVYAQFFSLIYKVGAVAHIIVVLVALVSLWFCRKDLAKRLKLDMKGMLSLEGLVYVGIILICAFCTSRGTQHADTYLYHAQAIRWIEEYGVVKGLGHLMPNYAYNSSWLCYTALFSMKFLTGISFHVTNGFMMAFISIIAVKGLWDFRHHNSHLTDAVRIAMLFYIVCVCVVAMSPSTDQPAMYLALYIVLRWLENMEDKKPSVHVYAFLCVAAVYTMTLKLSAGLIVLLVISPLITLIKNKDVKNIIFYLCLGIMTILPFFIRNVILSGWLIFPFAAIDLFNFEWKIDAEQVVNENHVITSYARKTYEGHLAVLPFKDWFPVWWGESEHYDRQLLIASIAGFFLMAISFIKDFFRNKKINWDLQLLNVVLFICVMFWLLQAPFIRFALGYLIVLPMLAIAEYTENRRVSVYKLISMGSIVLIVTCMGLYWSHYTMDTLVYVKQNLKANNWVMPKDYEATEYENFEVDGENFYFSPQGQLSYYSFPGAGHKDGFTMIGDTIREGFKAK